MSRVFVEGYGIVSPAGWGREAFRAVWEGIAVPGVTELARPDGRQRKVLRVPAPTNRAPWQMHPRMRRASLISQFTMGAAMEAMGGASAEGLGIVSCVMGGSVQYSRRFYGEVLVEPSTASPMLFPETVFNAPASHLAAVLGTPERNDTCVADETGFLAGLVVAADWLGRGLVRRCLVVAAEEADWTTAEAAHVFSRGAVPSEGAAAVLLGRESGVAELVGVSDPEPYVRGRSRASTAARAWQGLGLGLGVTCVNAGWKAEGARDLEARLGAGLGAVGGWACVAALECVVRGGALQAGASVAGSNLQAMAAVFGRA